jgi:hypothetical protein
MALLLVATVLTGLLLLAVALAIARGIDWRSNDLLVPRGDREILQGLVGSPIMWVVAFLALALGLTGAALVAVSDVAVAVPGAEPLAVVAIGSIVLLYLVGGTYAAARDRNVSSAVATLAVALILGALLLVAITGTLLMGP